MESLHLYRGTVSLRKACGVSSTYGGKFALRDSEEEECERNCLSALYGSY